MSTVSPPRRLFSASISTLIIICTSCWYMSSNSNAIASQVLFSKFGNTNEEGEVRIALLAQLLTTSQLVLGIVFSASSFFIHRFVTRKNEGMLQHFRAYDLFIGVLHYIGSLCTNMGFAHGSASLVQCVKLLEPIETLILMVLAIIVRDRILARSGENTKREIGQMLSVRKVTSTFVIIGGTMLLLTQKSMDPNPKSIVFALISGFCMASRNVLKKTTSSAGGTETKSKESRSSGEAFVSGIQSFAFITTMAAIPATCATLSCYVFRYSAFKTVISSFVEAENEAASPLARAIVFHCLYNVFSITVLCLTSATTHSLLNVGKRIVNVLAAAAYFGVALSTSGKGGILLAAVGAFLYNDNSIERIRKSAVGKYFVEEQDDLSKGGIETVQSTESAATV